MMPCDTFCVLAQQFNFFFFFNILENVSISPSPPPLSFCFPFPLLFLKQNQYLFVATANFINIFYIFSIYYYIPLIFYHKIIFIFYKLQKRRKTSMFIINNPEMSTDDILVYLFLLFSSNLISHIIVKIKILKLFVFLIKQFVYVPIQCLTFFSDLFQQCIQLFLVQYFL